MMRVVPYSTSRMEKKNMMGPGALKPVPCRPRSLIRPVPEPRHFNTYPDPAVFGSDFQDKFFLLISYCRYTNHPFSIHR
jgi:hypothetical protein